ncbi:YeiH family protein [Macrococcus sp. DPC7161]|uniref:YeiH family protein n=1 Tax=Macrococcus sp. DPC7161 TaxID=2507060 RepID=UPI00100A84E6|nr:YeiH family protein [Macrococcus sp. DPC7161]RXK17629.1 YeiH family putative sulfate export transporter [Macrococcus sp. DPC7161]
MDKFKGILLCFMIALVSTGLGLWMPVIGSVMFSILIGIVLGNLNLHKSFQPGIKYSSKKLLQYAIILMGFTLSIRTVGSIGVSSLPLTLSTITIALIFSYFVGRYMRIASRISTLIGVGTAICGGSAIAATSPIIKAKDEEIAFSISTIFLFNIVAVFLFPFLGHLFNMSQVGFGYFAGSAINDTSSVVAAGYTYGTEAGDTATIVKLVRALMIVPICFIIAWITSKQDRNMKLSKVFPWFILYFLLASLFVSIVPIPKSWMMVIKTLSTFLISMALAGIGLSVNINTFKKIGIKPVILGALTWFIVAVSSMIILHVIHIW